MKRRNENESTIANTKHLETLSKSFSRLYKPDLNYNNNKEMIISVQNQNLLNENQPINRINLKYAMIHKSVDSNLDFVSNEVNSPEKYIFNKTSERFFEEQSTIENKKRKREIISNKTFSAQNQSKIKDNNSNAFNKSFCNSTYNVKLKEQRFSTIDLKKQLLENEILALDRNGNQNPTIEENIENIGNLYLKENNIMQRKTKKDSQLKKSFIISVNERALSFDEKIDYYEKLDKMKKMIVNNKLPLEVRFNQIELDQIKKNKSELENESLKLLGEKKIEEEKNYKISRLEAQKIM